MGVDEARRRGSAARFALRSFGEFWPMGIAVNAGDFCEGATSHSRGLVSSQGNH